MTFETIKNIIETGENSIEASNKFNDGRINSIKDEKEIADYVKSLFGDKCVIAPPRFWYDISLTIDGKFYPINIKSVTGASQDNISSKEGLFYTVTGLDPKKENINKFSAFEEKMLNNINYDSDADYYFIIFFKTSKQIFFSSLKRVCHLVPNGNNLPFQCKWNDNKEYSTRNNKEQIDFLIQVYFESVMKKINAHNYIVQYMRRNFNE